MYWVFIVLVTIVCVLLRSLPAILKSSENVSASTRSETSRRAKWRTLIPEYRPCYDELPSSDYVVFDLETSGLDPERYEILEIGAIRFKNGSRDGEFHTYVKPQCSIPWSATSINGISWTTVCMAPRFRDVQEDFLSFIGDFPLVAHNARFDVHFLQTELGHHISNPIIDTLGLARSVLPYMSSYKLEDLKSAYLHMNISSHNALGDCEVTACLYQKCRVLERERWLKSRPVLDFSLPDDKDLLGDLAKSYYDELCDILTAAEKDCRAIHVNLFKNQRDFAIDIGEYRLCKFVFQKNGTYIVLPCSAAERDEIISGTDMQYTITASERETKFLIDSAASLQGVKKSLCRIYDDNRFNYQP